MTLGDLIMNEHDDGFWQSHAWSILISEQQRKRILCMSDYVIPGHGPEYQVTEAIRRNEKC